jgi:hypothetical protein
VVEVGTEQFHADGADAVYETPDSNEHQAIAIHRVPMCSADHKMTCAIQVIPTPTGTQWASMDALVRCDDTTPTNFYQASVFDDMNQSGFTNKLFKQVGGGYTVLDVAADGTGDTSEIWCQADGNAITGTNLSATDSDLPDNTYVGFSAGNRGFSGGAVNKFSGVSMTDV